MEVLLMEDQEVIHLPIPMDLLPMVLVLLLLLLVVLLMAVVEVLLRTEEALLLLMVLLEVLPRTVVELVPLLLMVEIHHPLPMELEDHPMDPLRPMDHHLPVVAVDTATAPPPTEAAVVDAVPTAVAAEVNTEDLVVVVDINHHVTQFKYHSTFLSS